MKDLSFHLLGDGEDLVDEGVRQTFHFGFGQDEAEVVLAVAAVAPAHREEQSAVPQHHVVECLFIPHA